LQEKIENMKKITIVTLVVVALVALALVSCRFIRGQILDGPGMECDTTDTLNTVEAVVKQVNAVYDYWNKQREHYDEKAPTVDERFGTKEWLQVREDAWAADRDCECGGFFDFGDEGPLDAWVYDCYEGTVSANDIDAKILSNGVAEVKFLVKDAVTTKGIPMHWLMRVEDGEWRVANIIFEKDGGIDLLESLRNYGWEFKTDKQFDISKWYDELVELAQPLFADYGTIEFHEYALIDVDRDGKAELYMRNADHYEAIFTLDEKDPHVLIDADSRLSISFFKNAIQSSGSCGTGCNMIEIAVLKDSKLAYSLSNMEQYDMEGNLSENNWSKDGKDISAEEGEKLYKSLGDPIDLYVNWHGINFDHKQNLSKYAE
jgi:hypothetical protein